MEAVIAANRGTAASYGDDRYSEGLASQLSTLFETDVIAFPVTTGTASNALALSAITPTFGKIYCHELAHINTDECGAPEFFTGGAKLIAMTGDNAQYSAETLRRTIRGRGNVHHAQPSTVSITQACEAGVIYPLDAIRAIAGVARDHHLTVHMDGARFANALVSLDVTPAEMTWKAGVEVLSLGGTKNGCLAAEVVVFFKPELVGNFAFLRKRCGQLLSKMRFVSAQLQAYFTDDVWLRNARQANAMAQRLSQGLDGCEGIELAYPTQSNEVFVRMSNALVRRFRDEGIEINDDEVDGSAIRFVAAWNTQADDIDALLEQIRRCCN